MTRDASRTRLAALTILALLLVLTTAACGEDGTARLRHQSDGQGFVGDLRLELANEPPPRRFLDDVEVVEHYFVLQYDIKHDRPAGSGLARDLVASEPHRVNFWCAVASYELIRTGE